MVLFSSWFLSGVILSEAKDLRQSPFAVFAAQGDVARRLLRLGRGRRLLVRFLRLKVRRVGRAGWRSGSGGWFDESRGGKRDVHLEFFVRDLLFVLAALPVCFVGVGEIPAAGFFVVAERRFVFAFFTANEALRVDFDRH